MWLTVFADALAISQDFPGRCLINAVKSPDQHHVRAAYSHTGPICACRAIA